VLALHAGAEVRHVDEFLGQEVNLDYVLYEPTQIVNVVEAAGLTDVEWYLRGPIAARSETTRRLYVVARKPA
jgi:hypothetical protein